ncbi:aminoacyl-tRNA deacylase [Anthocerotibacter panamensis]|uniref:aminoacyl-tRNA deacylase n=1 Tax=Anthocerotibacter panamensis TaxID=2857077 RepID=UPI001C403FD4|nr:YbaK/EbsC family protein [Anthocerotibacter panamensis]
MEIPTRLLQLLNEHQISYEVLHHPAAYTAQELAALEHIKARHYAKVVMVQTAETPLMAVLPADHHIDLSKLETVSGTHSPTLAREVEFQALFPDCAVGTMPPFGNLYGIPTYVDRSLTQDDYIVFEAGTHTEAVRMRYPDYERLAHPQIAEFTFKVA